MKKFIFLIAILVALPSFAQVSKFRYQSEKIEVGTVYHYTKSNLDDTTPEYVTIFVAAKDRLEVYKTQDPGTRAGLVIATMDWSNFMAKELESWAVTGVNARTLTAKMTYLASEKVAAVDLPAAQRPPEKTAIKFLPFHVYNFDLTSLNFAMRHLIQPQAGFTIGLADPNFAQEGPLFFYRGEVDVIFAGEEQHNGVSCRKYKIDGEALNNRGGFIWVNKAKEYIEEAQLQLPDNPNWESFKLVLTKVEKMTPVQWKNFMDAHFESAPAQTQ